MLITIGILLTATGVIGYIFSQDKFLEYGMIALVGIALLMLDKHTPYNEFLKQQSDSTNLINKEVMGKIMFSDKYGLTRAVLKGSKTQTRRIIPNCTYVRQSVFVKSGWEDNHGRELKPKYEVGEVVAVAQNYNGIVKEYPHYATKLVGEGITGNESGCTNKMFVRADLMPHHIEITGVWVERLQDISEEDCIKEGILKIGSTPTYTYFATGILEEYNTPQQAYAKLIDKICGEGTWQSNPFVWVYEFKLVE